MQKRLFIGISVPENLKKRIFQFVEKEYKNLPVRWVRAVNFHLTLNFLGYIRDEAIPEICGAMKISAGSLETFEIRFEKIDCGPSEQNKKMIWAVGKRSEILEELKFRLEKLLGFHARERKKFVPHITLGRIRKKEWSKLKTEPKTEKDLKFSLDVNSIELMESRFEKGKRAYYVLESFSLK